jgi:hypothetical protein
LAREQVDRFLQQSAFPVCHGCLRASDAKGYMVDESLRAELERVQSTLRNAESVSAGACLRWGWCRRCRSLTRPPARRERAHLGGDHPTSGRDFASS